jgi:deoxyribodipyrimidine photo-lyase
MINYVWLRRDLRIEDNTALHNALEKYNKVQVVFIFDDHILEELPKDDPRVNFIYDTLEKINRQLNQLNSSISCYRGKPEAVWEELLKEKQVNSLHFNRDYEPYATWRDENIFQLFKRNKTAAFSYKDQVIFEKDEVVKKDGLPYTVYTPYKNKWLTKYESVTSTPLVDTKFENLNNSEQSFPLKEELGIHPSLIKVKPFSLDQLNNYSKTRDFPSLDGTSYLSPHLRFGTVSVRQVIALLNKDDQVFLSELVWREFFMQILFHFPKVQTNNFKSKYDTVKWRNNEEDFEKWCKGETGYPIVDAGMRQLNETGYMHNRVRMITAGFLCKHLLIDWKWGEAYFAQKLLDYDLSANNGNWQWSAGTGCDSAPYFRIFNPTEQIKKFDKELKYIRTWVKDFDELTYPQPMVEHKFARERCLKTYKEGLLTKSL